MGGLRDSLEHVLHRLRQRAELLQLGVVRVELLLVRQFPVQDQVRDLLELGAFGESEMS
jgi:hypothetical protein